MSVAASNPFTVLPIETLTSPVPRILWIELSSKCPFDCIFCSRKTLHGDGKFMEMSLYRELLASLRDPEIIRLNYSGESIHHPDLMEAISLASATGAFVELVSAFASLPLHHIEPLVRSGLDRLTVSIHTLDAKAYEEIYGFSSLNDLQSRLRALRDCQKRLGTTKPMLDFAFVAMNRNLDQIGPLASYARELGVRDVFVHPLIRRDEIPVQFPEELNGKRLKGDFLEKLKTEIDRVQGAFADVRFPVSTHEIDPASGVNRYPNHHPGPLPAEARIFSCDQSPWDSVHVLANGDVVSCEVRDGKPLGNLRTESLAEIWHGKEYQSFRHSYQQVRDHNCSDCAYKLAYVPGPVAEVADATNTHAKELVSGWHASEGHIIWSKRRARVILSAGDREAAGFRYRQVDVHGLLPPGRHGEANRLEIYAAGELAGCVTNTTDAIQAFSKSFVLDASVPPVVPLELVTRFVFRPKDNGSEDVRELGFALQAIRLTSHLASRAEGRRLPRLRLLPLFLVWRMEKLLLPLARKFKRSIARPGRWQPGLSVVIPEAATPEHLERCLTSLKQALAGIEEPVEIIVSLNGSPLDTYRELRAQFPGIRWLHSPQALGFGGAIERGLREVHFDWVYLLNSDMVLDEGALRGVMRWRADHIFAVASQIFFSDETVRREETGWTEFHRGEELAEIFDVMPEPDGLVRGHLYAGGGSSLFRTSLLRRFSAETGVYHPMYFEDAEWGVRAWREGFETIFVPDSKVTHAHRATVKKLYTTEEVKRIFRRNQLLFSLRNQLFRGRVEELAKVLIEGFELQSQKEVASVGSVLSLLRAFLKNATAPHRDLDLTRLRNKFYLSPPPEGKQRPRVLVVTPYAIYPPAHGGARRLANLLRELATDFDIVVLSDEDKVYEGTQLMSIEGPTVLHLTGGRQESLDGEQRMTRIITHSHGLLRQETQRLADVYRADLVHAEFVELAALATAKEPGRPWLLTLHDVLLSEGEHAAADRFETNQIDQFDAVVTCCPEDAALLRHRRVTVVPNAADSPKCSWRPSHGNRTILFLGPFRYEPNLTGVVRFLETVYPRLLAEVPGIRMRVLAGDEGVPISQRFACFRQQGVEVHGHTDDVQAHLSDCALTVNPLSDIRGSSIKLVESLASGRICVSTKAGARGFLGLKAKSLVVVPDVQDMLEPIRELLTNEVYRMEQEAPSEALLGELSWKHSARAQARLYEELLGGPC
jgi:radical SAM protein with 4Fe4S-binding SPASM domain